MEKTLEQITGTDIYNSYILLNENGKEYDEKGKTHFIKAWETWRLELIEKAKVAGILRLSLNKKNYLGKATRALLHALNWDEPKTLGLLFRKINSMYEKHWSL